MCPRPFIFSELRHILLGSTVEQDRLASAFCGLPIVAFPCPAIRRFSTFLYSSQRRQSSDSSFCTHTNSAVGRRGKRIPVDFHEVCAEVCAWYRSPRRDYMPREKLPPFASTVIDSNVALEQSM